MPLKLIDPRPGKSPNFYIRGTYLGVYVDESAGTPVKAVARGFLQAKREAIERGELRSRRQIKQAATFLSAAISYINAGGERRFIGEFDEETGEWKPGLITHFRETPLSDIDQAQIDDAAATLYPNASPATRNRQVYTPVSAILKHAGVEFSLKRPKGAQGKINTRWLRTDQAFRLLDAAGKQDAEFGIFLTFLCYTGCRLSDALNLTCERLHLPESFAYFDETKNDDPRGAHLPPVLVAALANHPKGLDRGERTVFRFRKNGHLYTLLRNAKAAAGPDVAFAGFHTFCHTWATWMRRYGGLDTRGLVGTTRWKDMKSAARYEHVDVTEESQKADLLPTPEGQNKRRR
jgi:integrase